MSHSLSTRALFLLGLGVLTACQEYGYTQQTRVDVFQQNRVKAVDLLVVIDNSCSMIEEQVNVATNSDALLDIFADADVDWQIGVTTTDTEVARYKGLLMGGDDEIVLRGPSGEIDRVEYDRAWTFAAGTSLQLDPTFATWSQNDDASHWCAATQTYGDASHGNPGAWNDHCDGTSAAPPDVLDDEGPRAPKSGEIVVSEIMAWSAGADAECEWLEITNTTDDTLDLTGVEVFDEGSDAYALPDAQSLEPYGTMVLGRASPDACGAPVDLAFGDAVRLNHDERVARRDDPNAKDLFVENVAQGTIGTGIEMGLEAARLVFEEPYFTEQNQGFLREDATLAFLWVSDEEDYSPYSVDAYLRYFLGLKGEAGYRQPDLVSFSAVVGKEPTARPDLPSCQSENGVAYYGQRYLELVAEREGVTDSICEADYAPIIGDLGLTLSGLEAIFHLSEVPKIDTLVVKLYADKDESSLVGELIRDTDFTYVAESNSLHFDAAQVPPSEYYVTAEYRVASEGDTVTDEGGT